MTPVHNRIKTYSCSTIRNAGGATTMRCLSSTDMNFAHDIVLDGNRRGWAPRNDPSSARTVNHAWYFQFHDQVLTCPKQYYFQYPKTMDAKRISDGKRIMMKRLVKGDRELEIARFLSSEEMLKDPRNRCVPVLDVFSEEDSHLVFMVMPLLTIYSEPPFATVDEAVDFVRQLLEVSLLPRYLVGQVNNVDERVWFSCMTTT